MLVVLGLIKVKEVAEWPESHELWYCKLESLLFFFFDESGAEAEFHIER